MFHVLASTTEVSPLVEMDHEPYRLAAVHSVHIPALCQARIPHGMALTSSYTLRNGAEVDTAHSLVMLVAEPLVMVSHNLIVQAGPVEDGDLFTYVFNMSNSALKIRKGESISRLVRVLGSVWR